jgi:PTS system cellobiose-specific IIA component
MSLADYEQVIFGIITISGEAKSTAYEALRAAKREDFQNAQEKMTEVDRILSGLHTQQMELIQKEAKGEQTEFSVLLVHALDIMMDSLSVRDLVKELIEIYQILLVKGDPQ